MIELLVMIGVIGWFASTAKRKGRSRLLWGFIGAISYYGTVLVFGLVIYPAIVDGRVTYENQGLYMLVGIASNLVAGIGGCLIARKILLSVKSRTLTQR